MKILYVNEDRHENILIACASSENENIYVIPHKIKGLAGKGNKQYVAKAFKYMYPNHRYNLWYRFLLMKEIKDIADIEKPDIIHFVSADEYIRLFGFGLSLLRKYRVVLELHWCVQTKIRNFSRKILDIKVDHILLHVANIPEYMKKAEYIILPAEHDGLIYSNHIAREQLNLHTDKTIISMIGSMEKYKGVDILLKSLRNVKNPFFLILAGNLKEYMEEEILELIAPYKDNVLFLNGYVDDEKFIRLICASNYIMVPYRKSFEATSGPMTEAIRCGIPIIASDFGNVGFLTHKYNLGYLFEAENTRSLTNTIDYAIEHPFIKTGSFELYRSNLSHNSFRNNLNKMYNQIVNK